MAKALRVSLVLAVLAALAVLVRRALSSRDGDGTPDSEGIIR
jgi:hypothetical protein